MEDAPNNFSTVVPDGTSESARPLGLRTTAGHIDRNMKLGALGAVEFVFRGGVYVVGEMPR